MLKWRFSEGEVDGSLMKIDSDYQAQRKDEAISLIKMMRVAESDIRLGRKMSVVEAKKALRSLRGKRKAALSTLECSDLCLQNSQTEDGVLKN